MAWNADWLELIDARIRALVQRTTAVGTVTARTSDTAVTVTFDGSTVAVPCKVFGDVNCYAGDRVGLQRFGSDWVVVGTYTRRYASELGIAGQGTNQQTTSGTYGAIAGVSGTIVKRDTGTRLRATWNGSHFNNVSSSTKVEFGVQYTEQVSGGATYGPYDISELANTPANASTGGFQYATGIPAGTYTAQFVWRRAAGTGTPAITVDDYYSATVKEVGP